MSNPLYAWTLATMMRLQPDAPWLATYPETAFALVDEATAHPIFPGPLGVIRTLALDLALAWFESRFHTAASGDKGKSLGLFQINVAHANAAELLRAPTATTIANRLLQQSMRICRAKPAPERLGWYAGGGRECGDERARRLSKHRWDLAVKLAASAPVGAADEGQDREKADQCADYIKHGEQDHERPDPRVQGLRLHIGDRCDRGQDQPDHDQHHQQREQQR